MIKEFWKMYQDDNFDNIIIKNNTFRVTGFIEENKKFNNSDELRNILIEKKLL